MDRCWHENGDALHVTAMRPAGFRTPVPAAPASNWSSRGTAARSGLFANSAVVLTAGRWSLGIRSGIENRSFPAACARAGLIDVIMLPPGVTLEAGVASGM
jgi:hypothetical protein